MKLNDDKASSAVGKSYLGSGDDLFSHGLAAPDTQRMAPAETTTIKYGTMEFGPGSYQATPGRLAALEGLAQGLGDGWNAFVQAGQASANRELSSIEAELRNQEIAGVDSRTRLNWLDSQNYQPSMFSQEGYSKIKDRAVAEAGYQNNSEYAEDTIRRLTDPNDTYRMNFGFSMDGLPLSDSSMAEVLDRIGRTTTDPGAQGIFSTASKKYANQAATKAAQLAINNLNETAEASMQAAFEEITAEDPLIDSETLQNRLKEAASEGAGVSTIADPFYKAQILSHINAKSFSYAKKHAPMKQRAEKAMNQMLAGVYASELSTSGPEEVHGTIAKMAETVDVSNVPYTRELLLKVLPTVNQSMPEGLTQDEAAKWLDNAFVPLDNPKSFTENTPKQFKEIYATGLAAAKKEALSTYIANGVKTHLSIGAAAASTMQDLGMKSDLSESEQVQFKVAMREVTTSMPATALGIGHLLGDKEGEAFGIPVSVKDPMGFFNTLSNKYSGGGLDSTPVAKEAARTFLEKYHTLFNSRTAKNIGNLYVFDANKASEELFTQTGGDLPINMEGFVTEAKGATMVDDLKKKYTIEQVDKTAGFMIKQFPDNPYFAADVAARVDEWKQSISETPGALPVSVIQDELRGVVGLHFKGNETALAGLSETIKKMGNLNAINAAAARTSQTNAVNGDYSRLTNYASNPDSVDALRTLTSEYKQAGLIIDGNQNGVSSTLATTLELSGGDLVATTQDLVRKTGAAFPASVLGQTLSGLDASAKVNPDSDGYFASPASKLIRDKTLELSNNVVMAQSILESMDPEDPKYAAQAQEVEEMKTTFANYSNTLEEYWGNRAFNAHPAEKKFAAAWSEDMLRIRLTREALKQPSLKDTMFDEMAVSLAVAPKDRDVTAEYLYSLPDNKRMENFVNSLATSDFTPADADRWAAMSEKEKAETPLDQYKRNLMMNRRLNTIRQDPIQASILRSVTPLFEDSQYSTNDVLVAAGLLTHVTTETVGGMAGIPASDWSKKASIFGVNPINGETYTTYDMVNAGLPRDIADKGLPSVASWALFVKPTTALDRETIAYRFMDPNEMAKVKTSDVQSKSWLDSIEGAFSVSTPRASFETRSYAKSPNEAKKAIIDTVNMPASAANLIFESMAFPNNVPDDELKIYHADGVPVTKELINGWLSGKNLIPKEITYGMPGEYTKAETVGLFNRMSMKPGPDNFLEVKHGKVTYYLPYIKP